jgi:DNA-3-methyladenine glycosylase
MVETRQDGQEGQEGRTGGRAERAGRAEGQVGQGQGRLPRLFYDRATLDVARDLLGKVLVHNRRGIRTAGIIVEVEAYIGESDPACHAAPGPTRRNEPLYGPPGHAYVYLNYGIHCLMNVVAEPAGCPAAVLIRALDPLEGISVMRRRRARAMKGRRKLPDASALRQHDLCRGPGNLTMAMGITLAENRIDLLGDRLFVEDHGIDVGRAVWGPRVGIKVGIERTWRAYMLDHPAVSDPR